MFGTIVGFGTGFGMTARSLSEAKPKPKTKAGKKSKMNTAMHDFKHGKMHSGSKTGPVVKNRKQAIAIGLSMSGQSEK